MNLAKIKFVNERNGILTMEKEENNLGLAISKTAKCIRHGMEAWIAAHMGDEITTQQGRLLGYLYRHPEAGAADIQLSFGLSKSSVSELIKSLVSSGYLVYQKAEEDRRQRRIVLTTKGRAHEEKANRIIEQYEERLVAHLSFNEQATLEKLLDVVKLNAEEVLHEESDK